MICNEQSFNKLKNKTDVPSCIVNFEEDLLGRLAGIQRQNWKFGKTWIGPPRHLDGRNLLHGRYANMRQQTGCTTVHLARSGVRTKIYRPMEADLTSIE